MDLKRDGARRVLGELEYQVLDVLWRTERLTAREVEARVIPHRNINTIMSTLNRLVAKRVIRRQPGTPARFVAAMTREALDEEVRALLGRLFFEEIRTHGVPHFLAPDAPLDPDTMRRLAQLANDIASSVEGHREDS